MFTLVPREWVDDGTGVGTRFIGLGSDDIHEMWGGETSGSYSMLEASSSHERPAMTVDEDVSEESSSDDGSAIAVDEIIGGCLGRCELVERAFGAGQGLGGNRNTGECKLLFMFDKVFCMSNVNGGEGVEGNCSSYGDTNDLGNGLPFPWNVFLGVYKGVADPSFVGSFVLEGSWRVERHVGWFNEQSDRKGLIKGWQAMMEFELVTAIKGMGMMFLCTSKSLVKFFHPDLKLAQVGLVVPTGDRCAFPTCGVKCGDVAAFATHYFRRHSRLFVCYYCHFNSRTAHGMKLHLKRCGPEAVKFECKRCLWVFGSKEALVTHGSRCVGKNRKGSWDGKCVYKFG
jgi:hypothetical protein